MRRGARSAPRVFIRGRRRRRARADRRHVGRPSVASSPLRSLSIRFVTRAFGYQRAPVIRNMNRSLCSCPLPVDRDADRRRRPPAAELCRASRLRSNQPGNRPSHDNVKAAPLSGL
jgi:hypothetical protein